MRKYIETAPTRRELDEVLLWLKCERDRDPRGYGFYNNKNIIEEAFENGTLIIFRYEDECIGLVTWNEADGIRIDIDIFVIHPSYRDKGYGEFYYHSILEYYRTRGFKAIKLFCEPRISERFWRKMGLTKFPDCGQTEHPLTYYDVLEKTASASYINHADKIELWDVEPYEAEEINPRWTWYIEMMDERLLFPIIHPCNCNWKLRWSREGKVIKEGKVKYFTDEDYELFSAQFLYIEELEMPD